MEDNRKVITYYIYAIVSIDTGKQIYIGSTTQSLSKRWSVHKNYCITSVEYPVYKYIRDNGGIDNFSIELVKILDFTLDEINQDKTRCKEILRKEEGDIIRKLRFEDGLNILNKNVAGRTSKQYYIDNADTIIKRMKQYYKDNTDKRREYYQRNADKKREYQKEYYKSKKSQVESKN